MKKEYLNIKFQMLRRVFTSYIVILSPVFFFFISCQEPLNIEYGLIGESHLIVEGKITTDTTKHYVYLSKINTTGAPAYICSW